jgi:hypothetical protein
MRLIKRQATVPKIEKEPIERKPEKIPNKIPDGV